MKTIAIVGRTNVGKSTIFNRLCQKKLAIVHDMAGVTRDRKESTGFLYDLSFRLIDTAGLEETTTLAAAMWNQTRMAIQEADIILAVIDCRTELTQLDIQMADELRRLDKKVILLANKCEGKEQLPQLNTLFQLGLGEPIAFSGEHGLGLGDLHSELAPFFDAPTATKTQKKKREIAFEKELARLEKEAKSAALLPDDINDGTFDINDTNDTADTTEEDLRTKKMNRPLKLSIVGRPNVGKSTLINRLLGQDRLLTGPEAGVTRDAITIPWTWRGKELLLTDTAGLRKRGKITHSLEKISAKDTTTAIDFAEVVILVLDANVPMEKQDLLIASKVLDEGRALLIALNKWDDVENQQKASSDLKDKMSTSLQNVKGLPVHTISGKTGYGLDRMLSDVFKMYELWNKRVPTHKLNTFLATMTAAHPTPIASNGKRIPMKYITQVNSRPPTFVIFSSNPDQLPESYLRYLSNGLREQYGLVGVPIRIHMRKRENPYENKSFIRQSTKAKLKVEDREKRRLAKKSYAKNAKNLKGELKDKSKKQIKSLHRDKK